MSRPAAGHGKVRPDRSLARVAPRVWVGGAPLRLFRVTDRGDAVLAELLAAGGAGRGAGRGARRGAGREDEAAVAGLLDRLILTGAAHPVPAGGGDRSPGRGEVTVVVPVRDRAGGLPEVLGALGGGTAGVVVVDDGSRDPDAVVVAARAHGASVVRHDRPRGPAGARNAGLAAVRTELVAFVDSDVVCARGWLEPLLALLADPRVALVAPRVRSTGGSGLLAGYEAEHSPLDLGPDPAPVRPRSRVPYVPAAALVGRAPALRELGGFDESLRFGEDVDLVWRLGEAGHLVRYEPAALVHHQPRPDWPGWAAQRFAYGSSAAELDRRHPGAVAPVVCSGWSAAAWALAASGSPVLGAVLGAGSAVALARKLPDVPPMAAASLALRGHLGAGRQLARAVVRPWWPVALAAAAVSPGARRVAAAALAGRLLGGHDPVAHRFVALADDAAYGAGVWWGAWRARRPGPLLPAFPAWPPTQPPTQTPF